MSDSTPASVSLDECVAAVGFEHIYSNDQLPVAVASEMTDTLRQLVQSPMELKTADVKLYIRRLIGLRACIMDARTFGEYIDRPSYFGYIQPIDDEKVLKLPPDKRASARPLSYAHECIGYEICNRSIDFARRVLADSLRVEREWIAGREAENEHCRDALIEDMKDAQSFLQFTRVTVLKEWTDLDSNAAAKARNIITQLMTANRAYRLWAKGWMAKWCVGQSIQDTATQIDLLKRAAIHFEACYKEMVKLEESVSLSIESADFTGEVDPLVNYCTRFDTVLKPREKDTIPDIARRNFEDAKVLDITWCHLCKLQWVITMGDALWLENKRGIALSLWLVAIKNGGIVSYYKSNFEDNLYRLDTQEMVLEPLKSCSFPGAKCAKPKRVDVNECIRLIGK